MSEHVTATCDICSTVFDQLTIRVIVPVYANGKIRYIHLCRVCFLETEEMTALELIAALNSDTDEGVKGKE